MISEHKLIIIIAAIIALTITVCWGTAGYIDYAMGKQGLCFNLIAGRQSGQWEKCK